jgi:hypothetical protein
MFLSRSSWTSLIETLLLCMLFAILSLPFLHSPLIFGYSSTHFTIFLVTLFFDLIYIFV